MNHSLDFDVGTVFITVLSTLLYLSFFERGLHQFVMHKKWPSFLGYAFEKHHVEHHGQYPPGPKFVNSVSHSDSVRVKITMAWWNWIVLVPLAASPWIAISLYYGIWSIGIVSIVMTMLYYIAYESIHWCMHVPENWWIKRTRIYRFLLHHHEQHHRKMNTRFNVVLPFADLFFAVMFRLIGYRAK